VSKNRRPFQAGYSPSPHSPFGLGAFLRVKTYDFSARLLPISVVFLWFCSRMVGRDLPGRTPDSFFYWDGRLGRCPIIAVAMPAVRRAGFSPPLLPIAERGRHRADHERLTRRTKPGTRLRRALFFPTNFAGLPVGRCQSALDPPATLP